MASSWDLEKIDLFRPSAKKTVLGAFFVTLLICMFHNLNKWEKAREGILNFEEEKKIEIFKLQIRREKLSSGFFFIKKVTKKSWEKVCTK